MTITKQTLDFINTSLEQKSWCYIENYLEADICDLISDAYIDNTNIKSFSHSKIGKGFSIDENTSIRSGLIHWLDDWDENLSLKGLSNDFF